MHDIARSQLETRMCKLLHKAIGLLCHPTRVPRVSFFARSTVRDVPHAFHNACCALVTSHFQTRQHMLQGNENYEYCRRVQNSRAVFYMN